MAKCDICGKGVHFGNNVSHSHRRSNDICSKGVHFGNNVSHSHRRSNAIWNSNVKNVKCMVNGAAKKLHVCTRCLKSGKVERA